ncbi:FbpB family small basic protein [Pullulanibacillus sp. KACC 23026]|nr:FbpB family small basic protein [Pullulanibacillus sp. KACC 23026]WEG10878.1 FbpB family small basic protein [Pullulanibacillus sp. KACC 23026]
MRKRLSIKELISQNKSEIMKDSSALDKIESRLEERLADKS